MTKPYQMELHVRAVRFVEAGESRHAVAARLGVTVSSVIKWLQRFSTTGNVAPGKVGGHRKPKISGPHRDWVLAQVKAGDVTLHGLADGLAKTLPGGVTGGRSIRTGLIPRALCSSTEHGPRPTWLQSMAGAGKASG